MQYGMHVDSGAGVDVPAMAGFTTACSPMSPSVVNTGRAPRVRYRGLKCTRTQGFVAAGSAQGECTAIRIPAWGGPYRATAAEHRRLHHQLPAGRVAAQEV